VAKRKSEVAPVKGYIKRSNKKGRIVTIAHAKSKHGYDLYKIVKNEHK
jgi:hypothetical protein